jgi:hypothetical protein
MQRFSIAFKNVKFVFAGLLLSSCGSVYYAPNTQNVTLFQEKGDAKLSVGISTGEDVQKAFELQSAYAITDHVGIMANFYRVKQDAGGGTLIELGGGYFQPLADKLVFETYGGISYAQVFNNRDETTQLTDFTRYFVQPAIGFTTNFFDVAFSTRFAVLNYHKVELQELPVTYQQGLPFVHLSSNRVQFLFEPALTLRAGWKNVKVQGQVGLSKNLADDNFDMDNLNFNIGLYISLSKKH